MFRVTVKEGVRERLRAKGERARVRSSSVGIKENVLKFSKRGHVLVLLVFVLPNSPPVVPVLVAPEIESESQRDDISGVLTLGVW